MYPLRRGTACHWYKLGFLRDVGVGGGGGFGLGGRAWNGGWTGGRPEGCGLGFWVAECGDGEK